MTESKKIVIKNASENNLKNISVEIPHNCITAVTGVSGSGKTSLVFDIINSEAQRRFFEFFSSKATRLTGKMKRPEIEHISGLSPVISLGRQNIMKNPRSTVGTLSGIYDLLRLLFARTGKTDKNIILSRNLFSYNSEQGACENCKGLGIEEKISAEMLIEDPEKTLRNRALKITTPNGYTIYSQVTIDVLNSVCQSEGFNVDIKWRNLSPTQQKIILYGSNKIKIPYGKHTLESRMKWTGITAKPREEGYYKGIIPVMEEILKRDRNKNILRFVKSQKCSACQGKRLNNNALSVIYGEKNIDFYANLTIEEAKEVFDKINSEKDISLTEKEITGKILKIINSLIDLGLEYLQINRESTSLSTGEAQRIRLANQINSKLSGITYIFDEPSIGLHNKDINRLTHTFEQLKNNGNTIIVIEHEEEIIKKADFIVDIGPYAGKNGGEIMFAGKVHEYNPEKHKSITFDYLLGSKMIEIPEKRNPGNGKTIKIYNACMHNLKNIDVEFKQASLNTLTGVSGAGKTTLLKKILAKQIKEKNTKQGEYFDKITGIENIDKIIEIDRKPIGKTSRSNPATYTKVYDYIRDLYAKQAIESKQNFDKSSFSFNVEGGRCEACEGAGYIQIGMHFLNDVSILCEKCNGKRFKPEILDVKYKNKSINDILEMQIDEAAEFFIDKKNIFNIINTMNTLGLGYITLGQSSATLSGGEAQRIKLAAELSKKETGNTLYILDEPTTGLHFHDVKILLKNLQKLVKAGNTIIAIDHNIDFIKSSDYIVDLGPGSGINGGNVVASGTPEEILNNKNSHTARYLKEIFNSRKKILIDKKTKKDVPVSDIFLKNVSTNNLKNIDVTIPANKITVLVGVSGSGKSSLAYDTIFAEGYNRYTESFSAYVRTISGQKKKPEYDEISGMMTTIAIGRRKEKASPRSTLGTLTEIYDYYRLLYSRVGQKTGNQAEPLTASMFSFNRESGACPYCKGLKYTVSCNPKKLITKPELALIDGAMNGSKTGKFYGDKTDKYIATLLAVAKKLNLDYSKPWKNLSDEEKNIALYGTQDTDYDIIWNYKRKNTVGEHKFTGKWVGFINLVNEEYIRKHADRRSDSILPLMHEKICEKCKGSGLNEKSLSIKFQNMNISELSDLSIEKSILFFTQTIKKLSKHDTIISENIIKEILRRLKLLSDIGLPYIQLSRKSSSLSSGELQRVKLAAITGAELTGICFVLDEPTSGLHSKDTYKLIEIIKKLCALKNTIVIAEHNPQIIQEADNIIELGPDAGENGGEIIFSGTFDELIRTENSKTGEYFRKKEKLYLKKEKLDFTTAISIKNARKNNLKNLDLKIPTGYITAITGVSGSGKSSLLIDVISKYNKNEKNIFCEQISGLEQFENIIFADKKNTSGTSTILTHTEIYDNIRTIFANTDSAKKANHRKNYFSLNQKGGRCETCKGEGFIKTKMDFLSDISSICHICNSKYFKPEALAHTYKGKNIYEILQMTLSEIGDFFEDNKISEQIQIFEKTGLGYLKAGQKLKSLSGGELQRLKLVNGLLKNTKGKTLYLFDEPAGGLHFEDIKNLKNLFAEIKQKGHTIIFTEHNIDMILFADYIIDLGPEGGEKGGEIIACGNINEIIDKKNSFTSQEISKKINNK